MKTQNGSILPFSGQQDLIQDMLATSRRAFAERVERDDRERKRDAALRYQVFLRGLGIPEMSRPTLTLPPLR